MGGTFVNLEAQVHPRGCAFYKFHDFWDPGSFFVGSTFVGVKHHLSRSRGVRKITKYRICISTFFRKGLRMILFEISVILGFRVGPRGQHFGRFSNLPAKNVQEGSFWL